MPRSTVLGVLFLSLLLGSSASAQRRARSTNPFDAEQVSLARDVRRSARRPRAYVPLVRIYDGWERTTPGSTRALLEELATDRRLPAPLRAYAGALHSHLLISEGDLEGAASGFRRLGYVTRFRVIGPFDNEGKAGYGRAFGPEASRDAPVDLSARFEGREREVGWRHFPDVARWGYVNLGAIFRPNENTCAYAETFVESERAQPITLWVGAGGAVRVWFNGEPVLEDASYRRAEYDRAVAIVPARAGYNRVLVKVCNTNRALGFYLRLGDARGAPLAGLRVDPDAAPVASPAPATPLRMPTVPAAPLAALEADVAAHPESASAHEDLARYLQLTLADDPDERRALEVARRAAELGGSWERWLLVSNLVTERAEVMRAVTEAERLSPRRPEVVLARAGLVASGADPDRALRMLEPLGARTTSGLRATLFRASMLQSLGLSRASLAEIERGAARAGGALVWLRARRDAVRRLGRTEEAMELTRAVLAARHDDVASRRRVIADALARHDREAVLSNVQTLVARFPDDSSTLSWAAGRYEALGMNERTLETHRAVIELAPENAGAHAAYGHALMRQGQRDAGAAAFRAALALRPQDEGLRALLEDLRPTSRADERYATAIDEILGRRRESDGWPATVLHDLTVNTVFDNGLSSSFHQMVTQVHDDDGARQWQHYSIPHDPATQYVDVRTARVHRADGTVLQSVRHGSRALGDPRYRIYYSSQAHVVRFPDLRPGDTIELAYRITDVAFRNVFNDYYGDYRLLGRGVPTRRLEYVLITPREREFYFNEPALPSLRHERREEDGRRVDHFVAEEIPAARREPNMPGPSETLPYLHVSTYRSWEDVGRWWWGLVQDQLVSDAALRRTVHELTDGVADVRTRVERIYGWVIRNTRYVGLEFGIHGFQPYRVPLIVQRGFGDCKDKASLLYVMLREAGIEARLVLVRTRRNGRIQDLPASLSVFDHAIAYVPELDLYLDGTAENGGAGALPSGDQGVTVLVVGPESAELRHTPVASADRAGHRIASTIALAADGSAALEVEHEVMGPAAASFRTRYQAAARRTDRLEAGLRGLFPGIEVEDLVFERLDELERPVLYRYRAQAPQVARREGTNLLVPPSRLGLLGSSLNLTPRRRHPLDLGGTSTFRERRTLRPPSGARIEEVPAGGVAESPFGRLSITYRREGRDLVVETELAWLRDRVELSEYDAFRRWVGQADALIRARVRVGGVR